VGNPTVAVEGDRVRFFVKPTAAPCHAALLAEVGVIRGVAWVGLIPISRPFPDVAHHVFDTIGADTGSETPNGGRTAQTGLLNIGFKWVPIGLEWQG
jgi:hypothetical protein